MENVVQAEMDADIRRCGLFGVISVALGLLLRIGLMPVASGQIDLDSSIWLNVERYSFQPCAPDVCVDGSHNVSPAPGQCCRMCLYDVASVI